MAVMHIDVFCTQFANLFCNVRFAKTNLFAIFLKIIVGHKKYYKKDLPSSFSSLKITDLEPFMHFLII
jgi:hypothetical protein